MDFAEKLRRRAAEAGHSVLVSTFHALIAAVDRESEEGKWETCVGPFEGVWHRDPCNHMVLAAHLTGQHLHLAHVQQHDDKTLYVVSWADEPDYERDFAARKRHMRPRLPDDPLFQEFESRKQKLSEKRKAVAESEEFKVFLASQPPPLTGAKAEREALRESRRKWTQFKDNMTREAKFQPPVREYRHAKLAAKLAPVPRASVLEPHRALQQGLVAAEPPKDVVVAVGPRKFMTKAEFLREKNAILDADFAERAKRNAEQLRQCKPDDLTGPLKEPGVKGLPVDLSEGQRSLCRCGQSAHFPFCDMSHVGVNARLGTKFSPFRVNAELVGKDVVVVCGCGESTKTIAGGIRVCDGTTCQNLPVAQKLRELEESPAEPEPMSVQLQRTSQVYEKAEEHKKNAIGNLRSSLRVQVVSERDFERLCDDFKAFVKFSTERLEMQHVDFPTSDNQRALVDFRADSLSVLQDLDARVQKLESTANEAGRDGGDFEDELQQVRKLRLAFNRLVADMEAEIEERVASQGPVTAAALARSHTLDEEDVLDKFDTMVKEYVSYARDTAARIEREYLEERVDEPAQQTLAAWQIDYREIERLSTTRFDDLEVMVEENKNSKDEFAVMLKFAVGARSKLHEAVKEVEEELKQKLKEELQRLEDASRSNDSTTFMSGENSTLNAAGASAAFDSDEEERSALLKEEQEKAEALRVAAELEAERKREQEEEAARKQNDILENQRQLEQWLQEKKAAEEVQRQLEEAKQREEEEFARKLVEEQKQEEERVRRELEEREIRRKEEEERERTQMELEKLKKEDDARQAKELEAEVARKRFEEEQKRREEEEREQKMLQDEERKKRVEEDERRRQEAIAIADKQREERLKKQQEKVVASTPTSSLDDLERRVAEAERKREEKKLAAKSPRRVAPLKEDTEAAEKLKHSALQREQAEKAAIRAQSGVKSLEKGDLAAGLKNTRSIDVDTPELIRKKESRPSKEANISGSPTGVFPGQEEVVSAPSVLRAPYSGKSWQQLAADRLPYCVRLLDVAKGRGETPATKQRESDGNWRPLSWSGLALLVERVAKSLLACGVRRGERVLLLADSCPEWGAVCLATQLIGAVLVTAFSSASSESLIAIVQEQLPSVLAIDDAALWTKLRASGSRLSPIKTVVTFPGVSKLNEERSVSWESFLARGNEVRANRIDGRISQISISDTSTICYSERSSRAVVLSHANEMFACDTFTRVYEMDSSDRLLSFMPLANPAERMLAVYQPINSGALVYYGDSLANLHDNIAAVQPTVVFSAPVLWERFAAAIKAKLGNKEPNELASSVQKKLKKFIGCSRLRLGLSSMTDMRPDTLAFYRALQLPVRAVYSKASLSGIATFNDGSNSDSMGIPFDGVSFYASSPNGELTVKGPCVCVAHYGSPPNNGETKTGDLVRITADRSVHFIGRSNRQRQIGQSTVQLDAIEVLLCAHPMVSNSYALVKDNRVVALLALNAQIASNNALKQNMGLSEYLASKECVKLMSDHVANVNKQLPAHSRVMAHRVLPKEFSVKEGEVTSHALVVPQMIEKKHSQIIKEL